MSALCDHLRSDLVVMYPNGKSLRAVINPSFHAVLLVRLAQFSSRNTFWIWRNLLIWKHAIDVGAGFSIGPSLRLPHPISIVIGGGSVIGERATIYQFVTVGALRDAYPVIGHGVQIFTGAVVVGDVSIGDESVIGALTYVDKDVPAGATARRIK